MRVTSVMVTGPSRFSSGRIHAYGGQGILGDKTLCNLEPHSMRRRGKKSEVTCKLCIRKLNND